MCHHCEDNRDNLHVPAVPGRRKILKMAGTGLAAMPLFGILSAGNAEAAGASPALGQSPFLVQAHGARSVGGRIALLEKRDVFNQRLHLDARVAHTFDEFDQSTITFRVIPDTGAIFESKPIRS